MQLSKIPMITEDKIQARVSELAAQISKDYAGREIIMIIVLKGGVFFGADLVRELDASVTVDFIRARSYKGTRSGGTVEFSFFPTTPLTGKDIIIVEDILDTGRTTAAIYDRLEIMKPRSLKLCALLDKPDNRRIEMKADYVGFTVEDYFVVGYGLDHDEKYRELKEVYVLEDV